MARKWGTAVNCPKTEAVGITQPAAAATAAMIQVGGL